MISNFWDSDLWLPIPKKIKINKSKTPQLLAMDVDTFLDALHCCIPPSAIWWQRKPHRD
jgi:hypothetical protein